MLISDIDYNIFLTIKILPIFFYKVSTCKQEMQNGHNGQFSNVHCLSFLFTFVWGFDAFDGEELEV